MATEVVATWAVTPDDYGQTNSFLCSKRKAEV